MNRHSPSATRLLPALGPQWGCIDRKDGKVALQRNGKTLHVADTLDEALDWLVNQLRQGKLTL